MSRKKQTAYKRNKGFIWLCVDVCLSKQDVADVCTFACVQVSVFVCPRMLMFFLNMNNAYNMNFMFVCVFVHKGIYSSVDLCVVLYVL